MHFLINPCCIYRLLLWRPEKPDIFFLWESKDIFTFSCQISLAFWGFEAAVIEVFSEGIRSEGNLPMRKVPVGNL